MNTKKGWDQDLMISAYKKEATYDAAVTGNATNFTGVTGHSDYDPDWGDEVQTDKDTVSGTEHGTDLDIIDQKFTVSIAQPRAKPDFVIAAMAAALGSITATQDGAFTAYRQKCVPVAVGTALPSFNLIGKKGGLQYLHRGCKVNSVALSMEEGKPVSCTMDIIGSGSRATNADSFIAAPTESWLLMKNGYIWLEQDAIISIDAANAQGTENISSGTPDDLKVRVKKVDYKRNNNLVGQPGFGAGNGGCFQDLDYGRRSNDLSISLRHNDATDLDYYLNKTILALEVEVKGALIAAGGAMYFGFNLVIPRFKLTKAPLPKGGVGDDLLVEYVCDVQDDGTNPDVIFNGYNAKAAYFAA